MERRRLGIVVVACVGLALGAAVLWLRPRGGEEPASSPRTSGESMLAAVVKASAVEEAASSPAPAASEPEVSPAADVEQVEVCGVGWVAAEADGSVDPAPILASPAMSEARSDLLNALSSSGDAFGEAARLAIELRSKGEGSLPLMTVEAVCNAAPCDATEKDHQSAQALFEQLARLATASTDPRVYGLAYEMCGWRRGTGPCSVLNAAQWARLDADNGYPWTYILADAIAAKDRTAIDDALFHIGAASRFEDHRTAVGVTVARQAGDSPEQRFAAEQLAEGALTLAPGVQPLLPVLDSCRKDAMVEANRRELCEAAASTLADRADSLLAMTIGSRIGRRLEWAPERLEEIEAIKLAAIDAAPVSAEIADRSRPAASMRSPLDCAAIDKTLRYVRDIASLGEVGYARQWLERSGKTAEYLRRGREQRILVAQQAAEAARSASAPLTR